MEKIDYKKQLKKIYTSLQPEKLILSKYHCAANDALLQSGENNPQSPPQYRMLDTLSTMPAFYEAFDVQPGDAMRRPDSLSAKIW